MAHNSLDNVVIVGGGTAGWITAIMAKSFLPNSKITLIESEEIGILGAGEGTTPYFYQFLLNAGISISEFIVETGATIKNGIKFTNWNGDNEYYYHNFPVKDPSLNPVFSFFNPRLLAGITTRLVSFSFYTLQGITM